tara:strand:+ start:8814 stop:9836 length:1023 start_codon:yes stop_codon:yes gene_type:complete
MSDNIEAIIVVFLVLLFAILSLLPIFELKYNLNLNETILELNKYCSYNKSELGFYNVQIKNTFMWNMTNYLFDFDRITNNFKKDGSYGTYGDNFNDIKNLNRDLSIVDGKFNIMTIYNKYLHYGLPLFILLWLYFISHIIYIKYYSDTLERYTYSIYSTVYLFIYLALYTIFFSIILKKITEIYADTNVYTYIMLMKELDIIIKEQNSKNKEVLKILKAYNNNVKSVGDVAFDINMLYKLTEKNEELNNKNEKIENTENFIITLENIKNLYDYNNKKSLDKIHDEIIDVVKFIYTYLIFIIAPLVLLTLILRDIYMYYMISFIVFYIIGILIYNASDLLN